MDGGSKS